MAGSERYTGAAKETNWGIQTRIEPRPVDPATGGTGGVNHPSITAAWCATSRWSTHARAGAGVDEGYERLPERTRLEWAAVQR
jgi:hypothetical protein